MMVMDECFLANMGSKYGIDASLPLRLQKRALLKALGFPGDPRLKGCRSCETSKVIQLFKEYGAQEYPFLIIVSEKPMLTLVPQLFVVNDANSVRWRDNQGMKWTITVSEALSIINGYPQTTYVEFAPNPWGERTIAGRLIYVAMDNQVLEMQQGTVPAKLINDRQLPTYSGELSFLDLEKNCYLEDSRRLRALGFSIICSLRMIRNICRLMPTMDKFKELCLISQLPTLEFAFTGAGRLMAIDIDWPAQYIEKKGGR